jgi:hypothetical protein
MIKRVFHKDVLYGGSVKVILLDASTHFWNENRVKINSYFHHTMDDTLLL